MKEEKDIKLVELGKRIRDIRTEKALTQADLAKQSDLSCNYLAMLERGERNPTYLTLLKLAQGLNTTPSNLFKETATE